MLASLVDVDTGRVSIQKAKDGSAYGVLVDPVTGIPFSSTNPLPTTAVSAVQAVITTLYECIVAFPDGANTVQVGDFLQNIVIYNASGVVTSNIWNDLTQGFSLSVPPNPANVQAYVEGGAATSANQTLEIAQLTAISGQLPPALGLQPDTDSLSVVIANQNPGGVAVEALFLATVATGSYDIGDTLQAVSTYEPGTPNVFISTSWNNLTKQTVLAVAPPASDIIPANSANYAVVTNNYYAIADFLPDYAISDVLQNEIKLGTATNPPAILSSKWTNLTTGTVLVLSPAQANILPVDTPTMSGALLENSVPTEYLVIVGSVDAAVGDVVEQVSVYNVKVNPPLFLYSTWNNLTQGTTNITAPASNELAPFGSAAANTTRVSSSALYQAIAPNAGNYAVGDIIQNVTVFDTNQNPPTTISSHYDNLTQGIEDIPIFLAELRPLGGPVPNPATVYATQLTVGVVAMQAPSQPAQNGFVITALSTNTDTIYIGGDNTVSTSNGYPLIAGQSISYGVSDLSGVWYLGLNTTDVLAITGN